MVLTTSELIASLHHEVHILLHLASKVDQRKIEAVLPRLARAAQDALERSPSRQQESG